MYQLPNKRMSFWQIYSNSFSLYKASFKSLWIWMVLMIIFSVGLAAMMMNAIAIQQEQIAAGGQALPLSQLFPPMLWLTYGVAFLCNIFFCAATIYSIYQTMQGKPSTSIKQAAQQALGRYFAIIIALLLNAILFVVVVLIGVGLMFLNKYVGIIFLMLATTYIAVALFAWSPLVVIQNLGPVKSLKTAWHIAKGHWWRTFALFLVAMLCVAVINSAFDFLLDFFAHSLLVMSIGAIVDTVLFVWIFHICLLHIHNLSVSTHSSNAAVGTENA